MLISFVAAVLAPIADHEIKSLPGWEGALPSRHYSGYLPVGRTSSKPGYIHYWLILSEHAPTTDPLVYWTNGGPGASGISAGLLTEMGQFQLKDLAKKMSEDNTEMMAPGASP